MNYLSISNFIRPLAIMAATLLCNISSQALSPESFATSSKLASGKWAKVEVAESGMQFISNATLKALGFSDPDKVNVYGFGGRMLPEKLFESMPDDLPAIPSVRTPAGIVFFGHGCFNWEKITAKGVYRHSNNPYSDHSYYFISDRDDSRATPEESGEVEPSSKAALTTFTERLAHEQDLIAPTNTGRTLLGEDFRTQRKRSFLFPLTDNTGDAIVTVNFGTKTTGGSSSLILSANGTQLPATSSDIISATNSSSGLYQMATTIKEVEDPGEKLDLSIEYSTSGTLFTAALNYIEVVYERKLRLHNSELYFYVNASSGTAIEVDNCSSSTVIWDVTDPVNPLNVTYTLAGDKASFHTLGGQREYVAFNPTGISRPVSPAGRVANQDIHGMEMPDMVIITLDEYKPAAQKLADLHASTDGLRVAVLTAGEVYNEFSSGTPDLTAFRKLLKMWHDRGIANDGDYTRYCLLMGRPSYDNKMVSQAVKNAGYPRLPIWQSPLPSGNSIGKSQSYSTDDYIGMLDDQPGTLNMGSAQIKVAVGRMPVKSLSEANTAVAKLEKYIKSPNYGSWRNNVMIIADDQDGAKHMSQAERVYKAMRESGNGANFSYERLYLDSYKLSYGATGAIYPEAKQRMFDKLSEGVGFVNYIGHANPRGWGHESLLTWTDINSMTNTNLPFIYAATCEFLRWDDDEVSGAEIMWLTPGAGVIGMICPSREVYIDQNGNLNEHTARFMYMRDSDGNPMSVGSIMINGKNAYSSDTNKLRYGLMGDPSLRVMSPDHSVAVKSIKGIDTDTMEDFPVIEARSSFSISGIMTDMNGAPLDDFNGFIEVQLFDAETAITTNGNGDKGVPFDYNDHKSRLFSGKTRVTDGKWDFTVTMPSEIENNYSPALMTFYAYDTSGREANGAFDKFYVYGYNENAPEDFDGPTIRDFYLNAEDFTDGAPVSPSPILYAYFTDPSGINVSDTGIGHNMSLSIDNKTFFNDVNLFFTADVDDPFSGSIAYPISDIEPGEHSMKLTVWDNANNSSSRELSFFVSASWKPEITKLATDVSPASTSVNFIVATDGANGTMDCRIEVFDLSGKNVWTGSTPQISSSGTSVTLGWDLRDTNGVRVPRGIYIYRAIVTTPEGATIVKSNKLAVTAQ